MSGEPRAPALEETEVDADPLRQFATWYEEAQGAGIPQPEAMTLATATPDARPSARLVLLKSVDERGFGFHTSYASRKAAELDANPRAALVFYWHELGRQVRVEGTVERIARGESEDYFRTRPSGSRLAAWASRQSSPLANREELEQRWREFRERYPGDEIPLPPHWGGYRVVPDVIELWQHRAHRLHDRLRYTRARVGWTLERLAP